MLSATRNEYLKLLTRSLNWLLKYGSEEMGSSLCRCSSLLGFIMSKNLRGLWFYLLIKVHFSTSIPKLSRFHAKIKPIVPSQLKLDLAERTLHNSFQQNIYNKWSKLQLKWNIFEEIGLLCDLRHVMVINCTKKKDLSSQVIVKWKLAIKKF